MSEKIEKKKNNKALIIIISIILFVIGFILGYNLLSDESSKENDNKKKEENKEPVSEVLYKPYETCIYNDCHDENGKLYIDDKEIYECQNKGEEECQFLFTQQFAYCNATDSLAVLQDGDKAFLYDYKNKKIIFEADFITSTFEQPNSNGENYAYLVFEQDGKKGILSIYGQVLVDAKYDDIGNSTPTYNGEYNVTKKMISVTNNNLMGVINPETGEIIVPLEYDNIEIFDDYYVLEKAGVYSLTSHDLEEIFSGEYTDMTVLENYLFVQEDNDVFIYDLEGNKVIDNSFKTEYTFEHNYLSGYNVTSNEDGTLDIETYTGDERIATACYNANPESGTLTTIVCK